MHLPLLTSVIMLAVAWAVAVPHSMGTGTGTVIPIAKRSSLVNADGSVNFESLDTHRAFVEAKIERGFNSYLKNTGVPHPASFRGIRKRATGSDGLTDANGNELWYGTISVGTPSNSFTVDFDTGSSDLFLPGPSCTQNCEGHNIYDPSSSSTAHDLNESDTLSYGPNGAISSVIVDVYTDTVSIAGLTATGQTLGVATQYASSFASSQYPPDGLMGMAFQSLSNFNAEPVFQSLVSEGQTDQSVFSFKLATSGSELYLGGVDSALYTGDFTYTPVTTQGYWEVTMDSIQKNGQTVMSNIDSIIDTGTTLIICPSSQVASFYEAVGGTDASATAGPGYYTFPCDAFPSISFTFEGKSFPISNNYLNLGQVSLGSSDCVSGIMGADAPFWVIGDVFLMNVYTTFDVGNAQVGFAQLA